MGIMWNNTGVAEMARELNEKAGNFKNAVDGMYNLFRQDISNDWKGKAYNVVVEYVNDLAKEWSPILESLQASIPNGLTNQLPGKGYNDAVNYPEEIDISAWSIEPSADNLDTFLEQEQIEGYFNGQGEKSLNYYTDSMIQCLGEYVTIFDNHVSDYTEDGNTDSGVLTMRNGVEAAKTKFEGQINELMIGIIEMANVKVEEINEVDITTMKNAIEATSEGIISGGDAATDDTSKVTKYYDINSSTYQEKYHAYKDLDEEYISATELEEARNEYNDLNKKKPGSPEAIAAGEKYNKMAETFKNQTTTQADVDAKKAEWESFEERNNAAKKLKNTEIENRKARREADKTIQQAEEDRQAAYDVANKKYNDAVNKANDGADKAQGDYDDALNEYLEKYGNQDNQ